MPSFINEESGSFGFMGYGPHPAETIPVKYYVPDAALSEARILIVIPGRGRNAEEYRDDWLKHARRADVLLLVPELPADRYPLEEYNLGNLVEESGAVVPQVEWTFTIIEALFDWVRHEVASDQPGYYLYGHSAGAQFVHRFMLFMSDNSVIRAVSANAGWYTVLDSSIAFPYGLKGGPATSEIRRLVSAPLTILLGAEDDDPDADGLRIDPEADAQGVTRLERGRYFYDVGRRAAAQLGLKLSWDLVVVSGAAHSNEEMAAAAAEVMFG